MNEINIIGKKFGNLLVLEDTKKYTKNNTRKYKIFKCKCDCGNIVFVTKKNLNRKQYCSDCSKKIQKKNGIDIAKRNLINKCVENTNLKKIKKDVKVRKDSTTGITGVIFFNGRYIARLGFKKKRFNLGYFDNIEDAIIARKKAEQKYYDPILNKYDIKNNEEEN